MSRTVEHALGNPVVRTVLAGAAAFAGASTDLGRPGMAEAAQSKVCNGQNGTYTLLYHDAAYFDEAALFPGKGRVGIFDKGIDPWVERYIQAGTISVVAKDSTGQERTYASSAISPETPKLPGFTLQDTQFNIGYGLLRWTAPCDSEATLSNGKIVPGFKGWLVTSQDSTNRTFEILGKDGVVSNYWGGRKEPLNSVKDYENFLSANVGKIHDLTSGELDLIRKAVQEKYGQGTSTPVALKTPETPIPVAPKTPDLASAPDLGELVAARATAGVATAQAEYAEAMKNRGNLARAEKDVQKAVDDSNNAFASATRVADILKGTPVSVGVTVSRGESNQGFGDVLGNVVDFIVDWPAKLLDKVIHLEGIFRVLWDVAIWQEILAIATTPVRRALGGPARRWYTWW